MTTHERKIRIAWVETDAPTPVVEEAPPAVAEDVGRAAIDASGERRRSTFYWAVACVTFAAVQGWILPAIAAMFHEIGVRSVPALTEAVLGAPSLIYGLGLLSLLHASAVTRCAETRLKLRVVTTMAAALGLALTILGLVAPFSVGIQPL